MLSEKQLKDLRKSAEELVGTDKNIVPEQFISLIDDTLERLKLHRQEQQRAADRLRQALERENDNG